MKLMDRVGMLGIAVEEGLIDRGDAADLLMEYAGGRLNEVSALWVVDNHRRMHGWADAAIDDVAAAVKAIHAVRTAATPEEFLCAHNAKVAEMHRQRQAYLERERHQIRENLRRGNGVFGADADAKEA